MFMVCRTTEATVSPGMERFAEMKRPADLDSRHGNGEGVSPPVPREGTQQGRTLEVMELASLDRERREKPESLVCLQRTESRLVTVSRCERSSLVHL